MDDHESGEISRRQPFGGCAPKRAVAGIRGVPARGNTLADKFPVFECGQNCRAAILFLPHGKSGYNGDRRQQA
jgi:hypothetical protein